MGISHCVDREDVCVKDCSACKVLVIIDQVARLKKKNKQLLELLSIFPTAYPHGRWARMLHEEGCPGTLYERYSDGSRDNCNECKCDGDFQSDRIKKALRLKR